MVLLSGTESCCESESSQRAEKSIWNQVPYLVAQPETGQGQKPDYQQILGTALLLFYEHMPIKNLPSHLHGLY